jgi:hypothetical protein
VDEVTVGLWARAFAGTLLWEGAVIQAMLPRGESRWAWAAAGLGVNLATHPALWFLAPRFEPYALWLVVMEGLVFSVEAWLLSRWCAARGAPLARTFAIRASVWANAVSTCAGLAGWW